MARAALRAFFRFFFWLLSRLDVQGWERVPESGAALLAANHRGIVDAPLLFFMLPRVDSTGVVADKYRHHPILSPIVNTGRGIWINREQADLHALRQALHYLQAGGMLGIAPEGTRSRTGGLLEAKTGIAYLADKANCPVIPIAVWGSEQFFSQVLHFHRPHIHVRVGLPLHLPPVPRGEREAGLQRNTDEIMCHIAAMLPADYRGVYADHPRLKEILADENP